MTPTLLRPLRLGPIELDFPVVQAALSGYSDRPMRIMARRFGAAYTLCEVLLEKFLVEMKHSRKHRLEVGDDDHPVGGQLMGSEPEQFGPAAQRLVAAGFDVIDINFGCPVKGNGTGCRGGFHLGQPAVALEIVDRVRAAVPAEIPVTVKMRRALDDSPESRDNFYQIFDGAFARGVSAITVHGRTVTQRYDGPSNWNILREIKRHAGDRVVLGSGDLFTPEACLQMLAYTGVDGVTVARGAIGNPWIFAQARALAGELRPPLPSVWEQRDALRQHDALAAEIYDSKLRSTTMRKFALKYARWHPEEILVRNAFAAAVTPDAWQSVLETWYAEDRPGREPLAAEPPPVCGGAVG